MPPLVAFLLFVSAGPIKLTRSEFATRMSRLQMNSPESEVVRSLGQPDDVRNRSNTSIDPGMVGETWSYGTDRHMGLPTKGWLLMQNHRVVYASCVRSKLPESMTEGELNRELRAMHYPLATRTDPLRLIRVANRLRPLGKEDALRLIEAYHSLEPDDNDWLGFLLRALFDAPGIDQPPRSSPSPGGVARVLWRFPVLPYDGIPYAVQLTPNSMGGMMLPPVSDIPFLRAHGKLRAQPWKPVDNPGKDLRSAALAASKLNFQGPGWHEDLSQNGLLNTFAASASELLRTVIPQRPGLSPVTAADLSKACADRGVHWEPRLQMYLNRSDHPVAREGLYKRVIWEPRPGALWMNLDIGHTRGQLRFEVEYGGRVSPGTVLEFASVKIKETIFRSRLMDGRPTGPWRSGGDMSLPLNEGLVVRLVANGKTLATKTFSMNDLTQRIPIADLP